MEVILSLSSILVLLVASVFKLNPYLKLVLGIGLFVAFVLGQPVVMSSPIFVAQCLVLLVLITCTFIEKFSDSIIDLLFLAVPSLLLIGSTHLVQTFFILNLLVCALYFHSRGGLDRGLLKNAYFFSAGLDYLFISLVNARYFHDSAHITFAEVEYYLKESNSLYLLAIPIVSISLKTLTPLFCLISEKRSEYYRYYILQSFFLLVPFFVHKDLFIEGLKTPYYALSLVTILVLLVLFYIRTNKIERLLMFGFYAVFISCFVFDMSLNLLAVFALVYLIHRLALRFMSSRYCELSDILLGLIVSSIYIHLAIINTNLSFLFIALALFQFLYTLSPMLINKSQEELA